MLSKVQIKTIRALQHKKYRQKYSQFIAEGLKIVQELLQGKDIQVDTLFVIPEYFEKITAISGQKTKVVEVTERELKQVSCLAHPQGVLGVCKIPELSSSLHLKGEVTLLLEAIRNPGNLGTIIRIADWFGIKKIICSSDCVDIYNPKTVQATMGSIARVKLWTSDLKDILEQHKSIPSYAAALTGTPITHFKKIKEGIIIIGNESTGISEHLIQLSDERLTIPKIGQAESLNAAVATGIICGQLLL